MFFDSDPYGAWLDVVVTGLFIIAIATPALLWLTWRRNADGARDDSHPSFRDWAAGEFDTLTGPVKGANGDRRSPAADRCSRRRDDGAGIGISHHRERRRLRTCCLVRVCDLRGVSRGAGRSAAGPSAISFFSRRTTSGLTVYDTGVDNCSRISGFHVRWRAARLTKIPDARARFRALAGRQPVA
jgi:hypothetical protein